MLKMVIMKFNTKYLEIKLMKVYSMMSMYMYLQIYMYSRRVLSKIQKKGFTLTRLTYHLRKLQISYVYEC